ncbi:MAG TPA: hypothetical protein VF843_18075 [Streptosporangiaceae bacterium]
MPSFLYCPDCGVPAEVTDRFRLASTDGPAEHVTLRCAAGHRFAMPGDLLPAQARELLRAQGPDPHVSSGR